jgi:hypothetical protein
MRHSLPLLGLTLILATPLAQAQAPAWTTAAQPTNPTPTDDTGALGRYLALDATGNQYLTGVLQNGGGSGAPAVRGFGSTTLSGGTGLASGFVAKLSPTQQWLWAVRATCNGEGVAFRTSTVSPAGDTYASGAVQDDASVSPNGGTTVTVGSFTYLTTSATATFVTRLNANGQPQWLAGASGGIIMAQGWDAAAGNLVVAGTYGGTIRFGATTLTAAPAGGVFVARLDAAGQWVSALSLTPTGTTATSQLQVYSCAVGPQGQVGVNFRLRGGQVTLGSTTVTSSGSTDRKLVVAQLSAAGAWQWATVTTADNAYYSNNMQYDRNGNVWLLADAGSTPVQFGTTTVSNGEEFLGRLSAATGQWGPVGIIGLANGSGPGYTSSLAVDAQGNALVAGSLQGAKTFGPITLSPASSSGGNDCFVARYSAGGQWQFAALTPAATSNSSYTIQAIALDAAGSLFATGQLRGTATFGSSTLSNPSAFGGNVFVAKLSNAGVLAVRQVAGAAPLALYPNPASPAAPATLRLSAPTATALPVVLRDVMGRIVATASVLAGHQEVTMPTQRLSPGLYLIEAGAIRAELVVE